MDLIGLKIGNFQIIDFIGQGGMGRIYLARNVLIGGSAVVKILQPEIACDEEAVRGFLLEASAAAAVKDPGVAHTIDAGVLVAEQVPFIIMEYLSGETLEARLVREGPLPIEQALEFGLQISNTLRATHARGIVHLDLSPDNIMIVPDSAVPGGQRTKILDFGIARLVWRNRSNASWPRIALGKPGYMSPEQCEGADDLDFTTDIYALGCLLFHALCGRPPFTGATPQMLMLAQIRDQPPSPRTFLRSIPPRLEGVLLTCLEKSRDLRPASMGVVVAELNGVLQSLKKEVPHAGRPPDRTSRRLPVPAAGAVTGKTDPGRLPPRLVDLESKQIFALVLPETTIGRGPENDIQLTDRFVSRRHAKIVERNGRYTIEDLSGRNGVEVNGEKHFSVELKWGDRIRLGGVELHLVGRGQQIRPGPGVEER